MKKLMHGLFGDSSEDKRHDQVQHGHPEDLTGVHLNNQPIETFRKGNELAGVPLTIKIPMGYNVNPEHIHVTMEDRVLIVKYKNALDTQTGHMEEQLIKKIPMPEAVDAKKLRVMFKPEGYLLIEGPELLGSHQPQLASAAGETVKRDYADAVSHGVKKVRDDQPTVNPRLNEMPEIPHGQIKNFERETTYASKVVPPRVSEVGSQLGKTAAPSLRTGPLADEHKEWLIGQSHHDQNAPIAGHTLEPRGPYIESTTRPVIQQTQTVHGRFEGPLDTSGFASIHPTAPGYQIPGYMHERNTFGQVQHDVHRGVDQVKDKAEDVKHQAGQKWEETKDKAAELKHRAGDKLEDAKETVADKWEDTKEKAAELKHKAGDKLEDAKESVEDTWEATKDKAAELKDKAGDKLHDAKESIKEGWETTKEKASELAEKAGDKLEAAKEKIGEGWENTKEKVSDVAEKVGDKLEAAKDTVVEKTKEAKDKVVDAFTPEEKPEHHEVRREEFHRPIQPQGVHREHVRIEKDIEYSKPVGQQFHQPLHGRVETHTQHRQQQQPLHQQPLHQQPLHQQNLHQQRVQQSLHHGHVNQPQVHGQFNQPQHHWQPQQHQQHGRFEQHRVTEQHHRAPELQPLRQNANLERQAVQSQQSQGRRRSDETHLTESHRGTSHQEHKMSPMDRSKEHTPMPIPRSERQQDSQVPLVDTAVGRRMSQEDAKKPPSSTIGVEERDWVNKPDLRADHMNNVSFEDIMKQSVAHSQSGTGKTQVHFTPPAEAGRRKSPEGIEQTQQIHRDVNRPQPEGHERRTEHITRTQTQQHPNIQRHEVHHDVHEAHEDQPSKLERGLEKVADKVLGFFGVEVEGHHKPGEKIEHAKEQTKQKGTELKNKAGEKVDQAKQKGTEIKHKAGEKVDQAKDKAGELKNRTEHKINEAGNKTREMKHRAEEKVDQAGNKAQQLKHRAGEKIDQAGTKAKQLGHRAEEKVEETKEQAGEAWEKTKAKTAELKDQAGQKINDVKHSAEQKVDQAKEKATELKDKAGEKIEEAKDKTAEKWDETKQKASETWEDTKDKAAELKNKAGDKLEDAKESIKEGWENTKEKASELAEKAGDKLEAAKDTVVEKAKAAKDTIVDAFTPSETPEHHIQRSELHQQPLHGRTDIHQQQIHGQQFQQQPAHGQRTRIEKDYEYSRPLGSNLTNVQQQMNIPNPQMRPLASQFEHRQPLQQPGVTHFEKHVEQHRQIPGPTGKVEEHFEHHEVLPGQQPLTQRTGFQQQQRTGFQQHHVQRPGETVGHKMDQAKESVSETVEHGKERGQQMVNKAGEKLNDAKESVKESWEDTKDKAAELKDKAGDKLHDAKEAVVEKWEDTKDKAAELKDKAGDKLHDAKESVEETWESTKDKAGELKDKAGEKLHDAKEKISETWEDTKDKAAELKDKAGEKLHDAKEAIVDAKDTVVDKLAHAKDKVVDFFTPDTTHETHVEQKRVTSPGARPASHLTAQTALEERRRQELHGKPVSVRLEGPVTISGRVVGGEVLASDIIRGTADTRVQQGTHGARQEQLRSEVKTVPQQQQVTTKTTKVVHEESKTVAPGGLMKKGPVHQSPQAL